jgi:hypothetical protein
MKMKNILERGPTRMRQLFADCGADEHECRDHRHDRRRGLSHQTDEQTELVKRAGVDARGEAAVAGGQK